MINPMGNDVIDYELDNDLRNLWAEAKDARSAMLLTGDAAQQQPPVDGILCAAGVEPAVVASAGRFGRHDVDPAEVVAYMAS